MYVLKHRSPHKPTQTFILKFGVDHYCTRRRKKENNKTLMTKPTMVIWTVVISSIICPRSTFLRFEVPISNVLYTEPQKRRSGTNYWWNYDHFRKLEQYWNNIGRNGSILYADRLRPSFSNLARNVDQYWTGRRKSEATKTIITLPTMVIWAVVTSSIYFSRSTFLRIDTPIMSTPPNLEKVKVDFTGQHFPSTE